jgi:hypothetical protein
MSGVPETLKASAELPPEGYVLMEGEAQKSPGSLRNPRLQFSERPPYLERPRPCAIVRAPKQRGSLCAPFLLSSFRLS